LNRYKAQAAMASRSDEVGAGDSEQNDASRRSTRARRAVSVMGLTLGPLILFGFEFRDLLGFGAAGERAPAAESADYPSVTGRVTTDDGKAGAGWSVVASSPAGILFDAEAYARHSGVTDDQGRFRLIVDPRWDEIVVRFRRDLESVWVPRRGMTAGLDYEVEILEEELLGVRIQLSVAVDGKLEPPRGVSAWAVFLHEDGGYHARGGLEGPEGIHLGPFAYGPPVWVVVAPIQEGRWAPTMVGPIVLDKAETPLHVQPPEPCTLGIKRASSAPSEVWVEAEWQGDGTDAGKIVVRVCDDHIRRSTIVVRGLIRREMQVPPGAVQVTWRDREGGKALGSVDLKLVPGDARYIEVN